MLPQSTTRASEDGVMEVDPPEQGTDIFPASTSHNLPHNNDKSNTLLLLNFALLHKMCDLHQIINMEQL